MKILERIPFFKNLFNQDNKKEPGELILKPKKNIFFKTILPKELSVKDFEENILAKITDETDKKILNTLYKKREVFTNYYKYILRNKCREASYNRGLDIFDTYGFSEIKRDYHNIINFIYIISLFVLTVCCLVFKSIAGYIWELSIMLFLVYVVLRFFVSLKGPNFILLSVVVIILNLLLIYFKKDAIVINKVIIPAEFVKEGNGWCSDTIPALIKDKINRINNKLDLADEINKNNRNNGSNEYIEENKGLDEVFMNFKLVKDLNLARDSELIKGHLTDADMKITFDMEQMPDIEIPTLGIRLDSIINLIQFVKLNGFLQVFFRYKYIVVESDIIKLVTADEQQVDAANEEWKLTVRIKGKDINKTKYFKLNSFVQLHDDLDEKDLAGEILLDEDLIDEITEFILECVDNKYLLASYEYDFKINEDSFNENNYNPYSRSQLGKIIKLLNEINKAEPKIIEYIEKLAYYYILYSDYDKAIECYTGIINIIKHDKSFINKFIMKKKLSGYYYKRGKIYYEIKKDYECAIKDFNNALKKNNNYTSAYYYKSLSIYELLKSNNDMIYEVKKYNSLIKEDIDLFNKTLKRGYFHMKNNTHIYLMRGEVYLLNKEFEKAGNDIFRVLKMEPENITANILYGRILDKSGKFNEALKYYRKVEDIYKNLIDKKPDIQYFNSLGIFYREIQKYDLGIIFFTEYKEVFEEKINHSLDHRDNNCIGFINIYEQIINNLVDFYSKELIGEKDKKYAKLLKLYTDAAGVMNNIRLNKADEISINIVNDSYCKYVMHLAELSMDRLMNEKAYEFYKKALNVYLQSDSITSLIEAADIYAATGEFEKAGEYYINALNTYYEAVDNGYIIDYDKSSIYKKMAYYYKSINDYYTAAGYYHAVLEEFPADMDASLGLIECYYESDQTYDIDNHVMEYYNFTKDTEIYKNIADFITSKFYDRIYGLAITYYLKYLESNDINNTGYICMKIADLYKELKDYSASELFYKEFNKHNTNINDYSGFIKLAEVYDKQAKYGKAVNCIKKTIDIDPGNIDLKLKLANYYVKNKQKKNAINVCKKILGKNQELSPVLYCRIANIYKDAGKFDTALKYYKESIDRSYEYFYYYIQLGDIYMANSNQKKASIYYKKAIDKIPGYNGREDVISTIEDLKTSYIYEINHELIAAY